ncbi:MAG: O-antigen ligase family protein [Actinomycetota bacterium]|nr:O-antigen ligase family protein [Actinomycetota bacterium]
MPTGPQALTGPARVAGITAIGGAAGVAANGGTGAVLGLAGVAGALSLQALGWSRLVGLLVGATFVTWARIDVLGASFRPEHLALLVAVVGLVLAGRDRALLSAAGDPTVVLFGCFVAWAGLVSVLQAPRPGESLLIVGWLALDLLILIVLVGSGQEAERLARTAILWAGVAAAVAIALWVAARAAGTSFGVGTEVLGGAPAASGLSFEPNLLGATLALWGFMAFTGVRTVGWRARVAVFTLAVAGMALSLTRAAMVGLALGLVVWAALRGTRARARTLRLLASVLAAVAVLMAVAPGIVEPVSENVSRSFEFSGGTGRQRVDSWRTGVADLDGFDWVIGLGANSFGQRHLEPTLPTTPTPAYLANLPLQVVYDTGLVGALLLGATLLSVLHKRPIRDGRALGLLTVYVACAIATSPFWYGTTWVLVAIAVLDRRGRERSSPAVGQPVKNLL